MNLCQSHGTWDSNQSAQARYRAEMDDCARMEQPANEFATAVPQTASGGRTAAKSDGCPPDTLYADWRSSVRSNLQPAAFTEMDQHFPKPMCNPCVSSTYAI